MKPGTRVRAVADRLGVLDPDSARPAFLPDTYVNAGDVGEVLVAGDDMPEGWLLVKFEAGTAPVHPSMVEEVPRG